MTVDIILRTCTLCETLLYNIFCVLFYNVFYNTILMELAVPT